MKQTISVLVENQAGVLTRITGLFSRRACRSDNPSRTRRTCWAAWSASAPWSAPSALDLSSNSSMARSLRRFCNINLWKLLDLFLRGATH